MRILIVGGHGMLGEPVSRRLKADGHDVCLLARNPSSLPSRFSRDFEIIKGDVEKPASLEIALNNCDGVHINLAGGPKPVDYERVEHLGTANVAAAARVIGIERLTYLTGTSVCEENSSFYASGAKWRGEEAVRSSGVEFTIFRASWFYESLPLFASNKSVTRVGNHTRPLRWVAAQDYARMVSAAYNSPEAANQTLYIYGPESITMNEAIARFHSELHSEKKMSHMSVRMTRAYATLTFDAKLKDFANLMEFYEDYAEKSDPEQANNLLGAPCITLAQWLSEQNP